MIRPFARGGVQTAERAPSDGSTIRRCASAGRRAVSACVVAGLLLAAAAAPAHAQTRAQPARDGRLLVTVADQTGAVLPGATVAVTGQETATRAATIDPVQTSDQGVAAIAGLVPGRYVVQAAFPGFATNFARDVRVRVGDNKQTIVLEIEKLTDEITVGRDKQEAAADARVTFGSTLTREQVDALSDNPEEMRKQLLDMGGPGAVIRVDSFEGGDLPPKSQIKSIHITRDTFAAENHNAGAIFVEIITQPGIGPLRGGGRFSLRDGALERPQPLHAGQRGWSASRTTA